MGVRLERHQESAFAIARGLEGEEEVAQVLHPALPSFPDHDIWKRDFKGASGIFSFVLKVAGRPVLRLQIGLKDVRDLIGDIEKGLFASKE